MNNHLIAAIDIGTNTIRLLIWDREKEKEFFRTIKTTRLGGELVNNNKIISRKTIEINLIELKKLLNICKEKNCNEIYIFGTAALRKAENSNEFISLVFKETKQKIKVLSGEEEAFFSFNGIIDSIIIPSEIKILSTIDIGGGSTEIITAEKIDSEKNFKLIEKRSFELGCLHLTKKFISRAPTKNEEYNELDNYIKEYIEENFKNLKIGNFLIGASGTFSALVTVKKEMTDYQPELIHQEKLDYKEILEIEERLKKLNIEEREKYGGLKDNRGDIIIAGISIIKNILKFFKINQITISEYGILRGIIKSVIKKEIKNW
ncbi:MAG TPA: hypothetical protein PLD27_00825 [bacterium]|nr:hypothetical protein [bacterium]HOL46903.1 hypothetical protein [bacterium]HPQ18335.1 hypothetical protein [bacterium]